jgi:hypothetical protein
VFRNSSPLQHALFFCSAVNLGAQEYAVKIDCVQNHFYALSMEWLNHFNLLRDVIITSLDPPEPCRSDATWVMKVEDLKRLERIEKMMVRWICAVTLRDRKESGELRERLGIKCVSDVVW